MSNGSVSSQVSDVFDDADFPSDAPRPMLYLTTDHCRALDGGRVCGLMSSKCNRQNHKIAARGPPGEYGNLGLKQANSAAPDGDPDVFMAEDEVIAREAERSVGQQAENAKVGAQESTQAGYQASPLRLVSDPDVKIEGVAPDLQAQASGMFRNMSAAVKQALATPKKNPFPGLNRLNKASEEQRQLELKVAAVRQQVELEEAEARASAEATRTLAQSQAQAAVNAQARAQAQAAAEAQAVRETEAVERTLHKLRLEMADLEKRKAALGSRPTVTFAGPVPAPAPAPAPSPAPVPLSGNPSATLSGSTTMSRATGSPLERVPGGQDPGHNDETIFGIPKVSEEEVFEQLIPNNLPLDVKSELQTLLPDVVSPTIGTFNPNSDSGQEDMAAGFLNALENHTNVMQNRRGGFVKQDASWNTVNRVGLYKVKTLADFQKLHKGHVIRERGYAVRFTNHVRSVLLHYGYSRSDAQYFAESSRYSLICVRAHDLYGRLLNHLEREIAHSGFKAVKAVIDLFAIELVGFRDEVSRLSMWFSTYLYLRNLFQRNFWSLERQEIVNRSVWNNFQSGSDLGDKAGEGGGGGGNGNGNGNGSKCNHCQAHEGNANCPFKNAGLSRNLSRKLGKQAKQLGGRFAVAAKRVITEHEEEKDDKEGDGGKKD